jgi:hypothetical protein
MDQSRIGARPPSARALIALNRIDEARPLVEHLLATGYRHPALLAAWRPHASPGHP